MADSYENTEMPENSGVNIKPDAIPVDDKGQPLPDPTESLSGYIAPSAFDRLKSTYSEAEEDADVRDTMEPPQRTGFFRKHKPGKRGYDYYGTPAGNIPNDNNGLKPSPLSELFSEAEALEPDFDIEKIRDHVLEPTVENNSDKKVETPKQITSDDKNSDDDILKRTEVKKDPNAPSFLDIYKESTNTKVIYQSDSSDSEEKTDSGEKEDTEVIFSEHSKLSKTKKRIKRREEKKALKAAVKLEKKKAKERRKAEKAARKAAKKSKGKKDSLPFESGENKEEAAVEKLISQKKTEQAAETAVAKEKPSQKTEKAEAENKENNAVSAAQKEAKLAAEEAEKRLKQEKEQAIHKINEEKNAAVAKAEKDAQAAREEAEKLKSELEKMKKAAAKAISEKEKAEKAAKTANEEKERINRESAEKEKELLKKAELEKEKHLQAEKQLKAEAEKIKNEINKKSEKVSAEKAEKKIVKEPVANGEDIKKELKNQTEEKISKNDIIKPEKSERQVKPLNPSPNDIPVSKKQEKNSYSSATEELKRRIAEMEAKLSQKKSESDIDSSLKINKEKIMSRSASENKDGNS